MRAIVIGSNAVTRLSLIRCLGEIEGLRITVINMVHNLPSKPYKTVDSYSKYVDKLLFSRKFDADYLAELLMSNCRQEGERPIIFSVDDDSVSLIDKIQQRLADFFAFATIDGKAGEIDRMMDKSVQKAIARKLGFRVVDYWTIDIKDGEYDVPEDISYPCYIKGRFSYHSAKNYQRRCDSRKELVDWLKVVITNNPSPLIAEEFINIDRELGIIGYSRANEVLLPAIVELTDCGSGGHKGVSAFGRVRPFDSYPALKESIETFMKTLRYSGLFNIDIVESGGELFFVELNLRFAAYGFAVCRAGANLPAVQINDVYPSVPLTDDTLVSALSYVNENVAVDDVIGGYRTWKQYRSLLKEADCRLVDQACDPKPARHFRELVLQKYIIAQIKKVFGR